MSTILTKKLKIEDMHCSSCAISIDMDLEDLKGVKSARTSYAKQECEVEYIGEHVTEEILIVQIKKTGYKAKSVK